MSKLYTNMAAMVIRYACDVRWKPRRSAHYWVYERSDIATFDETKSVEMLGLEK